MAEFPTYEQIAKNVAEKALDEFLYDGKSIREWMKIIVKQESILDKIRAEIIEEKECAYADFERYKVEYLGQDWEDAYDSLPQDDFRYGMERVIEIIDKYRGEE